MAANSQRRRIVALTSGSKTIPCGRADTIRQRLRQRLAFYMANLMTCLRVFRGGQNAQTRQVVLLRGKSAVDETARAVAQ